MIKEEVVMPIRQQCLSVLFLFLGFASSQAATIVVSSGDLIGFNDITVGTDTYNVRFVEGSFISVFGDSTGLDFTTSIGARDASRALMDAFHAFPTYDDDVSLTFGLTNTSGEIFTPWSFNPDGQTSVTSRNFRNIDGNLLNADYVTNNVGMIATYDTGGANNFSGARVWADWSNVSTVPVPAAVWLFGSGLIGLVGFARRKSA